ncbi:MAG: outer membrane beta-barrel protein [Bacteroidota bacterium]
MELFRFLFVCLLSCFSIVAVAQPNFAKDPLKVGLGLSGFGYLGDMSESQSSFSRFYPGANFSLQTENRKALKIQLNGGFGKFSEQYDGDPPQVGAHIEPTTFVETSFFYGDLRMKYRFFTRYRFQPYLSIGAGLLFFTPRDKNGKLLKTRSQTRAEGESYSTSVPQVPATIGLQAIVNRNIYLGLGYTYRFVPTDYLDNIGELGNRKGFDSLYNLQLSLYFILKPQEIAYPTSSSTR